MVENNSNYLVRISDDVPVSNTLFEFVCLNDDFIAGAKFLLAEPFFQVWKWEIVTGGKIRMLWRMKEEFLDQYIKSCHCDYPCVKFCIVLAEKYLLLGQMR